MTSKELMISLRQFMSNQPFDYSGDTDMYLLKSNPNELQVNFYVNKNDEVEAIARKIDGSKVAKLITSVEDLSTLIAAMSTYSKNDKELKMKAKQMRIRTIKLGKYSKVACASEELPTSEIELIPAEEVVEDNPNTAGLEIMDVVILDNDKEVVVVDEPEPEDETIKVQDTETGVIADLPVEAFSKARKINMKGKVASYSETEVKPEEPKDEPEVATPAAEPEKPAEEPKIVVTIEEVEDGLKVKIKDGDPIVVKDKESLFNSLANLMDAKGIEEPKNEPEVATHSQAKRKPFSAFCKH